MDSHNRAHHGRRKRCLLCKELFDPDPRTQGKQQFCFRDVCQSYRQRQNEKHWRNQNPESRQEQNRKWQQKHRDYSRQRREAKPEVKEKNRKDTRIRMENLRYRILFDKSKSIMTQVIGGNMDKCYLTHGKKWLVLRLTRASPLSKPVFIKHNRRRFDKRITRQLPKGRVYDLGGIFHGPRS